MTATDTTPAAAALARRITSAVRSLSLADGVEYSKARDFADRVEIVFIRPCGDDWISVMRCFYPSQFDMPDEEVRLVLMQTVRELMQHGGKA